MLGYKNPLTVGDWRLSSHQSSKVASDAATRPPQDRGDPITQFNLELAAEAPGEPIQRKITLPDGVLSEVTADPRAMRGDQRWRNLRRKM